MNVMNKLKRLTLKSIRDLQPCEEHEPGLYAPANWRGNALDVLRAKHVPTNARIWVMMHKDVIPMRLQILFACWCARQAIRVSGLKDERSLAAVKLAERYSNGEEISKDDLDAASAAASAASAAARAASYAAYEAAYYADSAASYAANAANEAAYYAASAASAAARAAYYADSAGCAGNTAYATAYYAASAASAANTAYATAARAAASAAGNDARQKQVKRLILIIERWLDE